MTELDKLEAYLKENGYKYERIDTLPQKVEMMADGTEILLKFGERHQISICKNGALWLSIICHPGSYSYEKGLLEMMYFSREYDGDIEGFLTAEQIIEKLKGAPK